MSVCDRTSWTWVPAVASHRKDGGRCWQLISTSKDCPLTTSSCLQGWQASCTSKSLFLREIRGKQKSNKNMWRGSNEIRMRIFVYVQFQGRQNAIEFLKGNFFNCFKFTAIRLHGNRHKILMTSCCTCGRI